MGQHIFTSTAGKEKHHIVMKKKSMLIVSFLFFTRSVLITVAITAKVPGKNSSLLFSIP